MMNPFDWLKARTTAAVLDGFAEALDRIDRGDVAALQERVALALASPSPAAVDDTTEPAARTGKRGAK